MGGKSGTFYKKGSVIFMKILWITNQATPDIASDMGVKPGVGGGWMNLLSKQLAEGNELTMSFPVANNQSVVTGQAGEIKYYTVPTEKTKLRPSTVIIEHFKKILTAVQPDVIHIWGTEYVHTYEAVMASEMCGMLDKTVISIQGMVSVYAKHFYCGLSKKDFWKPTLRNIIYKNGINRQKNNFVQRGKYEQEALRRVKHVIGRTDWDEACTRQLNASVNYHFCNETLRESFYEHEWCIRQCERHSIFVSQAQYPIKGLHKALEDAAILKSKYPDIHLYTTGLNRMAKGLKAYLKMGDYDRFIRQTIKRLNLTENVSFLGALDENAMRKKFLSAQVFVSPSSIENSPNSVGEAMLLGMPVVSSDVGGVKNMLTHEKEGYVYQADAAYMMAYYIDKIFSDDELAVRLGENARKHAMMTHDKEKNFECLLAIYNDIVSQ